MAEKIAALVAAAPPLNEKQRATLRDAAKSISYAPMESEEGPPA